MSSRERTSWILVVPTLVSSSLWLLIFAKPQLGFAFGWPFVALLLAGWCFLMVGVIYTARSLLKCPTVIVGACFVLSFIGLLLRVIGMLFSFGGYAQVM